MNVNIKNSIRIRVFILLRNLRFFYFSLGGKTLKDKFLSYYLRGAMENPFERRMNFIQSRIIRKGPLICISHKYFKNLNLQYNLLDNFEMAICHEFFIQHTYDLSKLIFIPDRIIDCGAYRGYFSFLVLKYFPKASITSIEAHPENYSKIKQSMRVNNLTNIELLHGAICKSTSSYIDLFFEGSSGSIENTFSKDGKVVMVKTINLEKIITHNNLLLKVDIEGAELDFFPSIIKKFPPTCAVFLETHDGWNSLVKIKEAFVREGFSFEVIREQFDFIDSFAQRKKR